MKAVLFLLALSSCASKPADTRSPARILNVCAYNLIYNYMAVGASPGTILQGDAKKVSDLINNGRNLGGVCDENENTLYQEF